MVLLLGAVSDSIVAAVALKLAATGTAFLLLDPRHYSDGFDVTLRGRNGGVDGSVRYERHDLPLSEVRSAFVRRLGADPPQPESDDGMEDPGRRRPDDPSPLSAIIEYLPCLVVNRPSAGFSNTSKPYQQQLIGRHGFRTPRTLVTNEPDEARRFYQDHGGRVIYKSASQVRSIVTRLSSSDLGRLDRVRGCPTLFQEQVPGVDVRVHVVGDRIFATEISTDAVDYRYATREGAGLEMRPYDLPEPTAATCVALTKAMGLALSGIDLRRTPSGEYVCFEVNPSPAYTYSQERTGQPIGNALVDLLRQGMA
jgi:hypothetical protein